MHNGRGRVRLLGKTDFLTTSRIPKLHFRGHFSPLHTTDVAWLRESVGAAQSETPPNVQKAAESPPIAHESFALVISALLCRPGLIGRALWRSQADGYDHPILKNCRTRPVRPISRTDVRPRGPVSTRSRPMVRRSSHYRSRSNLNVFGLSRVTRADNVVSSGRVYFTGKEGTDVGSA